MNTIATKDTNNMAFVSQKKTVSKGSGNEQECNRQELHRPKPAILDMETMMISLLRRLMPGLALIDVTFSQVMNRVRKALIMLQEKNHAMDLGKVTQFSCHIAAEIINNLIQKKGYEHPELQRLLVRLLDTDHPLTYRMLVGFEKYCARHRYREAAIERIAIEINEEVFEGDMDDRVYKDMTAVLVYYNNKQPVEKEKSRIVCDAKGNFTIPRKKTRPTSAARF